MSALSVLLSLPILDSYQLKPAAGFVFRSKFSQSFRTLPFLLTQFKHKFNLILPFDNMNR